MKFKDLFSHPMTKGLNIDDPESAQIRFHLIQHKSFLKKIYQEWYSSLAGALPQPNLGPLLELGSGGGFLRRHLPAVISSEVQYIRGIDIVLNGLSLPFKGDSLGGILMTNVFHHLPCPEDFLAEACRCLKVGGIIAMIEPWNTPWSNWIYQRLHDERFDPGAQEWEFTSSGPLTGANGALPWVIFERDKSKFASLFPNLDVQEIKPFMPFRYLLSGGISMRSLMPGWTFNAWRWVEDRLNSWNDYLAMFARIVIKRRD